MAERSGVGRRAVDSKWYKVLVALYLDPCGLYLGQ